MNVQKVTLKLFTDEPSTLDLTPFLSIFARWRLDKSHSAQWIDLADYAHIAKGPGVILVGNQGNLVVDFAEPGAGILWTNKKELDGKIEDRILQVIKRTLTFASLLTSEPEYPTAFKPKPGFWELSFNDRLEAPNNDGIDATLRPHIESAFNFLFGEGKYVLTRQGDPGRRYGFIIHSETVHSLDSLLPKMKERTFID